MMKINSVAAFILSFAILGSCDLPRDNPLDINGSKYNSDLLKELTYSDHQVVLRYPSGSSSYDEDNVIKPGDHVFLRVEVRNTGKVRVEGVRGYISSSSDLVNIIPIPSGYFLKFTQSSDTNDYIEPPYDGFGTITNGSDYQFADNFNSYAVEFTISESAESGDVVNFSLEIEDSEGISWNDDFSVAVQ